MKLKKLELHGFKSFADRTVFEFEDSFSALVGPNGSGKSNVVDAIKWVLGERSAQKLRGAEMTNVIFDGSETRKPASYAEVKLTIDNADRWLDVDYEEVCMRRRLDRTGQSEYFVNGQQCRLKDIRALLLDTGVGTSCYSVIEQGQIDRILRASPKERRQVFEEAAGINRFLEQKKEAERKLERVANDLARVSDIIEEVQHQLRSVKYQAGRARAFKRQSERLQRLRLAQALHSYRTLGAERDACGRDIAAAQAEKGKLAQAVIEREQELEAARAELQNAQNELSESRQELARADARAESLAREIDLSHTRQQELAVHLEELESRRTEAEGRAGALGRESEETSAKLQDNQSVLDDKSARFDGAQRQVESIREQARRAEQDLEARKAGIFDLFQRESQLRNQVQVLATEARTLRNRLERTKNRQEEIDRQLSRIEGERSTTQSRLEELHEQGRGLDEAIQQVRSALAAQQDQLAETTAREADTKAELSSKVGRRDVLQDLEARAEGLGTGVKKVLDADLPGMVGLVADLLQVPLERAAAIEAALGDRARAVAFESAEGARQALRLLTEGERGRAELLVLERLAMPQRVDLLSARGGCGRLSDLVGYEPRAGAVVHFLLGNAFLVEDASAVADLLAAGLPAGVRLVTPSGECYDADGVWSAGKPETPSLISRRSELAELGRQIAEFDVRLGALARTREDCARGVKTLTAERESLAARAEKLGRDAGDVRSHLQVASSRAAELREELNLARAEQAAVEQDIKEVEERGARLEAECAAAAQERAEAQKAVAAQQEALRALQEQQRTLADSISSLGSELARAREEQRGLQSLLERLQADRQRTESDLAALRAEREGTVRRRQEAEQAAESAEVERRNLEARRKSLAEALAGGSERLQQLRDRIGELVESSKQLTHQREEVDERLHALRMAENETAVKMQDLLERTAEADGVHLLSLEMEPEAWRESPPFAAKAIREFSDYVPEPEPAEPAAAWYRELEDGGRAEQEEEEEGPELIGLDEATELCRAVLELANDSATNWEAVKTESTRLKARVDRIGNVNVGAIRQQEELGVRLQFLTDQKEDLEAARRHEREIIRELNKKSRDKFQETFEQVRQNFQALFRKLFGGGSADLLLDQQEEDALEAGIDIMARPPGKEANSITLLSGGEKTLTTIALLLAIFQAKPSPFCLLDEVDAPLDDSNVERFLMLLDEFRRGTQFIVVTHNKLTMSVAQVLYGLTMADGVSKKISVKFEQVDRELAEEVPRAKAG